MVLRVERVVVERWVVMQGGGPDGEDFNEGKARRVSTWYPSPEKAEQFMHTLDDTPTTLAFTAGTWQRGSSMNPTPMCQQTDILNETRELWFCQHCKEFHSRSAK